MTARKHTRATRTRNARIVKQGGGICWLCGHPGADAADHKIPLALGGPDNVDNLAPAHHFEACQTCGVKCNRAKSGKLIAPVMRRTPGIFRP